MFRRKRYAATDPEMPWWSDEATHDPDGDAPRERPHPARYGYDEHGYPGPPAAGRPGAGPAPLGGPPPLAAHDPFGGWPAFAGDPDGGTGGWHAFAHAQDAHPGRWPGATGRAAGPAGSGSRDTPIADPPRIDPAEIDPAGHDPAHPLLTHPVGAQRFQPDLEAGPIPPASRAAAGRSPCGPLRDSVRVEDATTWLPAITDPAVPDPAVPDPAVTDPAGAAALAGAFAADYLSWDQDDPARRGQVLAQYLPPDIEGDPSLLGWSGKGRQRADFALPGTVSPDGDGRVMVDVRVRVTPFRRVGASARTAAAGGRLEVAGVPAAAPAPTAKGWRSLDAHWVRMSVPVLREHGRLFVDTWDETLGTLDPDADGDGACEPADPTTAEDAPEDAPDDAAETAGEPVAGVDR